MRIYRTIIRPTVRIAYETWVLSRTQEERLKRRERKTLGSILGGIDTIESWRRTTNKEVYAHYEEQR